MNELCLLRKKVKSLVCDSEVAQRLLRNAITEDKSTPQVEYGDDIVNDINAQEYCCLTMVSKIRQIRYFTRHDVVSPESRYITRQITFRTYEGLKRPHKVVSVVSGVTNECRGELWIMRG